MFLIYSKDNCSYCTKAKEWFKEFNLQYIEFNNPPQQIVDNLKETTCQGTYPFIYCGDTFIGGYKELLDDNRITTVLRKEYDYEIEYDF